MKHPPAWLKETKDFFLVCSYLFYRAWEILSIIPFPSLHLHKTCFFIILPISEIIIFRFLCFWNQGKYCELCTEECSWTFIWHFGGFRVRKIFFNISIRLIYHKLFDAGKKNTWIHKDYHLWLILIRDFLHVKFDSSRRSEIYTHFVSFDQSPYLSQSLSWSLFSMSIEISSSVFLHVMLIIESMSPALLPTNAVYPSSRESFIFSEQRPPDLPWHHLDWDTIHSDYGKCWIWAQFLWLKKVSASTEQLIDCQYCSSKILLLLQLKCCEMLMLRQFISPIILNITASLRRWVHHRNHDNFHDNGTAQIYFLSEIFLFSTFFSFSSPGYSDPSDDS